MQYYNNILCVEAGWMIEAGVINKPNYDKLSRLGDIRVVRRGCRGCEALVDYESLPERFKRLIKAAVKDPHAAARENVLESYIEHSVEASAYYEDYTTADGRHLPAEKRREYYANAIVLEGIGRFTADRNARRRAMGAKTVRFWESVAETAQELDRTRYPHSLPSNARSLERKYKAYREDGYISMIHKTYISQNKNAAKVQDEYQTGVLVQLASDPRNLDNAQVARLYNMLAGQMGWKKITASTVGVWRDKLDDDIYARRHGATAYRNNKAMQVKRSAPTYPMYYWTLDGWDAELLYQTHENGRTILSSDITIVVVLDACLKYPIGYAIGTHENPTLIKAALRNAAQHTEELFGQMYRTAQLQSDNYSIKKMMPLYSQMGDKATPARAHNAKAKVIEPWFVRFNKKYCQMQLNWSGYGVKSRKELQPNSDFLNKLKYSFPDFEGVCRQLESFILIERNRLRDEYLRLWGEMPSENRFPLSYNQYLMLYGETTGQRSLLRGSGLAVTIRGVKRHYDCFDEEFRRHASVRWEVRYDPDNLSRAMAVNEDETLQFMLEEKYVQPMALIERKEGDYEELQRVMEFNRRHEAAIAGRLGEKLETATAFIDAHTPPDKRRLELLQKLMLCDSDGQHKDRRNEARLSVAHPAVLPEEESRHEIPDFNGNVFDAADDLTDELMDMY